MQHPPARAVYVLVLNGFVVGVVELVNTIRNFCPFVLHSESIARPSKKYKHLAYYHFPTVKNCPVLRLSRSKVKLYIDQKGNTMPPKKLTPNGKAAPKKQTPPAAPKTTTAAAKKPASSSTKFVRNIRNITVRGTLDNGRRIELKPRGERGDLISLSKEDVKDSKIVENMGMIWEVVSEAEAQDILNKQGTNQQVGETAFDQLLNEYGKPYEQGVKVEESFENQGEVVATLEDTGDGRFTEGNTNIVRSSGGAPDVVSPPGAKGNPVTEAQADGDALRSVLNVSIEPTQRG